MKSALLLITFIILAQCTPTPRLNVNLSTENAFSFSLLSRPYSLHPSRGKGLAAHYLLHNLHRGLMKYTPENKLVTELAKSCQWTTPKQLTCELKTDLKWSNGAPLTAQDFVKSFQNIFAHKKLNTATQHLLSLKNAQKILKDQLPPTQLGIHSSSKNQIIFDLDQSDHDLLYKLALPQLAIHPPEEGVTSGPFTLGKMKDNSLILVNNKFYYDKTPRPNVQVYFITKDSTALQFYQKKQLSLLKRLPTHLKNQYAQSPDFFSTPTLRFDYLGIAPQWQKRYHIRFRQALSHSLNFDELQKFFQSDSAPGCLALNNRFYSSSITCLQKSENNAKFPQKNSLSLAYSILGGDDHRKAMEWFQAQWLKNIQLKVTLKPIERGQLHTTLKNNPPDLFRKGLALKRPTCLAALENFHSQSHRNYIQLKSKPLDKIIHSLAHPSYSPQERKQLCTAGIHILLKAYRIIPLGEFSYFMLQSGKFQGWGINELNQLDLTQLQRCKKKFCYPLHVKKRSQ